MFRIIDNRGTGKTSKLMQIAKDNNAVFVCSNPYSMEQKAKSYNIDGINFISYNDFIHDFNPDIDQYVVDELEIFLKHIFTIGPELIGYTISNEN